MKNKGVAVVLAVVALIVVGVAAVLGYNYVRADINGDRKSSAEYNLIIEPQDFQYEIAAKLKQGGIISNDTVWSWWMDKHYSGFTYLNGEYFLTSDMSYEQIAEKLQNPDISHKTVSVCIPEGYTVFDIAKVLDENEICDEKAFLDACRSADKYKENFEFLSAPQDGRVAYELEGFLFPATYDMQINSDPEDIVELMLETFSYKISDSWTEFCNANNMTVYELITLASVVEKETLGNGVAENIASVFINRLKAGQQLQSDVTVFYGNALREAGFADDVVTSYNTYKCKALPSGPVCNPGIANIEAVINHTDTDYYYFFSDLENEFHFAKTYDEFTRLLNKYPWQ